MTDIQAIIFDCDGVLFESHSANLAFYNKIFSKFDMPLILDPFSDAAHVCHTDSSPVVLAKLMEESDVPAALEFSRTIDYREFIPLMTEATDLKDALKRLSLRYPLAVATNRGDSMKELLEHFELAQYFRVVVTSCDVKRPKPAPDMLLLAAEQLKTLPAQCVFIGDSVLDHMAATDGGVPFIAFGGRIKDVSRVQTHTELARLLLNERGI